MTLQGKRAGAVSLGCDKNRVDTERVLGLLRAEGAEITADPAEAEILVVNTCGFLESAREESIDEILLLAAYRERGRLEKLVVTGCLPETHAAELFDGIPEVDVLLGARDYALLPAALERAYGGERVNWARRGAAKVSAERVVSTPLHYAYLRIADGCDNRCTYCLIPSIRGKYVSEPEDELAAEAAGLGELSELILVAQDVTRYGEDAGGGNRLVPLIRRLTALENIGSVRLLYCYPQRVGDDLISELGGNAKLVKYLDLPMQHAAPSVLRRMRRLGRAEDDLALIRRLRSEIPGISLRSTFIAGFPGETEDDFEWLKDFLREAELDYAGFFAYSREEGTPAARLPDQIPEEIKERRRAELYAVQTEISARRLGARLGKSFPVTADGADFDRGLFYGHAAFQCPDLDGRVYFTSSRPIEQGKTYSVRLERTENLDLYGVAK